MRRRNPNWGSGRSSAAVRPAGPTAFETCARSLGLDEGAYATSRELRAWCERNLHRCYVPERLLAEWGLPVEPILSD